MNFLKWFLYTSLFAALCAVGLCMATEKLFLGYVPALFNILHVFVAANTLIIYNLHYFIKSIPPGISDRADWSASHKWVHPVLIAAGCILSASCLFFLNFKVIAVSIGLGILSVGYSLPILPFPQKRRLKDWGILKLILLSLVWTSVTVLMPMFFRGKHFGDYELEFWVRFAFMVPLCIAFDIRDMETDKSQQIYTLPNAIGLKNSYRLMDLFLLIFCALSFWQYLRFPYTGRLVSALSIAALSKIILNYSKKMDSDRYYLLFVDGLMLVYALFILLFHQTSP